MMSEASVADGGHGDPRSPRRDEPDAHGQAALLLAESTLHTLLEADILTLDQAIDTVRAASEVKVEVAQEAGESNALMQRSLGLLQAIGQSLTTDDARAANQD